MDIWSDHKYVPPRGMVVEVGGIVFRHYRCELCGRDFIEDIVTGERHAVNLSAFDFVRLARKVSDRWLKEPCPRKPLPSDARDSLNLDVSARGASNRERDRRSPHRGRPSDQPTTKRGI